MKRISILLLSIFVSLHVSAQQYKLKVVEKDYKIDKIDRTGLEIQIEADKKTVEAMWKKEFKNYGKTSSSGKIETIEQAKIPQLSPNMVKAISMIESSGNKTTIWMAVDLGDTWIKSGTKGYSALEDLLKDFARNCYKSIITAEIQDAEKALEKTVKSQEKVVKEGESLLKNLDANKKEKQSLEDKLKENEKAKDQLEKSIEQNKKDQNEASSQVAEKQKAVDIVKSKLNKID